MLVKLFVIALLIIILYCLGSALFFMLKGKKDDKQMARALTWRVSLSLLVFLLLVISFMMGWIQPHDLSTPLNLR